MRERLMDDVLNSLGDHRLDEFDRIMRSAHERYRSYPPEQLIEHSPRTAATATYDHIVAEADRIYIDQSDVRPLEIRGLKLWLFGDLEVIRFKRMDEGGRSRRYPTKQARAFDAGEELPGLPPPPTRLTVGYLLDRTGTEYIRSQIALPLGRGIGWCAAIVPESERVPDQKIWTEVVRAFPY